MNKALLIVLLLINTFFIVSYSIGFNFVMGTFWTVFFGVFFVMSIVISTILLIRSRKASENLTYLSLAVLTLSIGSFGWYLFINYLFLLMG